ncbi:hypothetical protein AAMO2058_001412900 [Amorphochlora amoebiformis]
MPGPRGATRVSQNNHKQTVNVTQDDMITHSEVPPLSHLSPAQPQPQDQNHHSVPPPSQEISTLAPPLIRTFISIAVGALAVTFLNGIDRPSLWSFQKLIFSRAMSRRGRAMGMGGKAMGRVTKRGLKRPTPPPSLVSEKKLRSAKNHRTRIQTRVQTRSMRTRASSCNKLSMTRVRSSDDGVTHGVTRGMTRVRSSDDGVTHGVTRGMTRVGKEERVLLVDLVPEPVFGARFLRRPSTRNKSPYVADIEIESREAIAHVPCLDCGGKMIPNAEIVVKRARNRKGVPVSATAVGKYGTPKCEFIAQLLRVSEPENKLLNPKGVWIGIHPKLGEQVAESLLKQNLLDDILGCGGVVSFKREVEKIAGSNMRADFVVVLKDGSRVVLEVKMVVDTDFNPNIEANQTFEKEADMSTRAEGSRKKKKNKKSREEFFRHNRKVVSSRAIKHIDELAQISKGILKGENGEKFSSVILFVVVRSDVEVFRPNFDACPSFAKHLKAASDAGVRVIARKVEWGEGRDVGKGFDGGVLKVELE